MIIELLQGHLATAFWLNPALFIAIPLAVAWWLWKRRNVTSEEALLLVVAAALWGVARNIFDL